MTPNDPRPAAGAGAPLEPGETAVFRPAGSPAPAAASPSMTDAAPTAPVEDDAAPADAAPADALSVEADAAPADAAPADAAAPEARRPVEASLPPTHFPFLASVYNFLTLGFCLDLFLPRGFHPFSDSFSTEDYRKKREKEENTEREGESKIKRRLYKRYIL